MPNLEWIELAARLGGAVLAGAILGVNRDLHRKPAGLRTLALVCLGSAVVVVIVESMPQAGAACEPINYDPLVMADGIAPTNDPVLLFRSPSYALSFVKRIQGQ